MAIFKDVGSNELIEQKEIVQEATTVVERGKNRLLVAILLLLATVSILFLLGQIILLFL